MTYTSPETGGEWLYGIFSDVLKYASCRLSSPTLLKMFRPSTYIPACGWLGMPSHTEAVWEGVFFFFSAAADCADQVNTRCGSLVWNFVLIIHCHGVKIKLKKKDICAIYMGAHAFGINLAS